MLALLGMLIALLRRVAKTAHLASDRIQPRVSRSACLLSSDISCDSAVRIGTSREHSCTTSCGAFALLIFCQIAQSNDPASNQRWSHRSA